MRLGECGNEVRGECGNEVRGESRNEIGRVWE